MSTTPQSDLLNTIPVLTEEQKNTIVPEIDPWSDERAAAIAIGDFRKSEEYVQQNHSNRFQIADQLYLGYVKPKQWANKNPRAAVAVHLVFEQCESMLPSVVSGMFPDEGELPFSAEPLPGSSFDQAKAARDLIAFQLRDLGDRNLLSCREAYRRHAKSRLLYGNGVTEFGYLQKTITREMYERKQIPQLMPMAGPNGPVHVPMGVKNYTTKKVVQIPINKPMLNPTDIRDFFWDANCNSHNINDGGYCASRSYMTINSLLEYDGQDGFRLPRRGGPGSEIAMDILQQLARQKQQTQADQSKRATETYRGMTWNPNMDYSTDPNLARLEVIRYWQKNRHVWIIRNYTKPIYNQPNCYGVLPFLTSPYVDVPGRWAGISLADLCETDQKLVETILNARLDELALLIHPPIIKKRGIALPLSQQKIRPGLMWESEDPSNDFKRLEMGNVTAQAFIEVNEATNRTARKTGITDIAVIGTPSAGGNSANRTATGVQAQSGASGKRIQYQVENDEDWFVVPMLNAIHAMNQKFLDPDQAIQILGPEAQNLAIDPILVLNASVKFKITAAGKMKQKAALQSGGLGLILQTFLNPELINVAAQFGMKPNFPEYVDLTTDTLGVPAKSLFLPMSPEEQQALQQQQQAGEQMRMQMQRERIQGQAQNQDDRDETKLLITLLTRILTPEVAHAAINQITGSDLDYKEPKQLKAASSGD